MGSCATCHSHGLHTCLPIACPIVHQCHFCIKSWNASAALVTSSIAAACVSCSKLILRYSFKVAATSTVYNRGAHPAG